MENTKIVYGGIREVINGKAVFMRQSVQYEQVYGLIGERLKDGGFYRKLVRYRKKEKGTCRMENGGTGILCELTDEGWECLFDEIFARKISRCLKETDNPAYRIYTLPMSVNGVEKRVDVTGFLIYGILCNKQCRQMLWAEVPDGDDYYGYYGQSGYRNWALEECLKAEEIWDARILTGLLEKMRLEEKEGGSYRLLMKIIYAGYGELRNWMDGKDMVTGNDIKTKVFSGHSEEYSMLYCISEIVIAMAIAQDMGVEICLDYDMLLLLHFMERGEREMREGNSGMREYLKKGKKKQNGKQNEKEKENEKQNVMKKKMERALEKELKREMKNAMKREEIKDEIKEKPKNADWESSGEEKKQTGNYVEFLDNFREKYGTVSSLEALVFGNEAKRMERLLLGVMAQYHISPRMFCGMDLTETEVEGLLELDDKWTVKSYWSMLVIAHLCKYIGALKENCLMKRGE